MSADASGVDVVGLQDAVFVSGERHDEELGGVTFQALYG
jgi:hypothetical protein